MHPGNYFASFYSTELKFCRLVELCIANNRMFLILTECGLIETNAQDEGKIPLRKSCGLKWVNKQPKTKRSIIFKLDFSLFGTTNVA